MEYIKGIDGFRGFLVICIVIFHIFTIFFPQNIHYFPGGFLAVESFFVLSGFLIVRLLINIFSNSESRIKALQIYLKRRFLRIFPNLLFMVATLYLTAFIFFNEHKFKIFEESIFGLSFTYNFYLLFKDIPYFQKFEEINFLLHLWSLSIEFQLYLLTGFIFFIFGKNKSIKAFLFILIVVLSLLLNYFYFNKLNLNPDNIYLSTEARSFGFFIGGLTALFEEKLKNKLHEYLGYTLGIVGSLLLMVTFFYLSNYSDWFYPFGFLIADFLSVIILIGFLNSKFFRESFDILGWIGARSYSLYLWHYPLFIFFNLVFGSNILGLILLTFILIPLSDITYRIVEEPFRKLNYKIVFKPIYISFTIFLVLIGGLILISNDKSGNYQENLFTKYTTQTRNFGKQENNLREEVKKTEDYKGNKVKEFSYLEDVNNSLTHSTDVNVFMIGDSVLLGAASYIKRILPNAKIDAKVGRQASEILEVIENHREYINNSDAVVIHIGTNGFIRKELLENIVSKIGSDKKIYFLTVNAPVPWKEKVNENIRYLQKFPNIRIIEWDKYIEDDFFAADKVHLSKKGIIKYASLIKSDLSGIISTSIGENKVVSKKTGIDYQEKKTVITELEQTKPKDDILYQQKEEEKIDNSAQDILDSINRLN